MHQLHYITEHVYWFSPYQETDRPILGAITGTYGTLFVDAGNSQAHAALFLKEVTKFDIAPPKFLVLTHWHWDHVFGAAAFNLPTFAHIETKRIVTEMAQLDWSDTALDRRVEQGKEIEFCRDHIKAEFPNPDRSDLMILPPDIGFTDQIELDLGGVTCYLVHVGGDHSADATVVYVPGDGIVFLGDCIYPDLYQNPVVYTTHKFFVLLDRLLGFDADFYLDAHNPEPTPKTAFQNIAEECKMIGQTVNKFGDNRTAILAELATIFQTPLDEEQLATVDAFLAGHKNYRNEE